MLPKNILDREDELLEQFADFVLDRILEKIDQDEKYTILNMTNKEDKLKI